MAEAWISVDEAATHLGVAKDSIYRWIDHKGLPARSSVVVPTSMALEHLSM